MIIPIVFQLLILGGGFYLAVRAVRALERRRPDKQGLEEVHARMRRMEETIESLSSEVQRLGEAQSFTTRLLEGRREPPA
jgi:hypothetical protein